MTSSPNPPPARRIRVLRWITPVVVLVEIVLVLTDVLSVGEAVLALLVVEALLAVVVCVEIVVAARSYRAARATRTRAEALEAALRTVLPGPVAWFLLHELQLMHSLTLWLRRRKHGVPPGAVTIRYDAGVRPLVLVLLFLSIVELVVVELVVPWQGVRIALFVLGLYGVLFLLAVLADLAVRPHVVSDSMLHLRIGSWVETAIPVSNLSAVTTRTRHADRTVEIADGTLTVAVNSSTQVQVLLREPVQLTVGRQEGLVEQVRFSSDDPAEAHRALAERIAGS